MNRLLAEAADEIIATFNDMMVARIEAAKKKYTYRMVYMGDFTRYSKDLLERKGGWNPPWSFEEQREVMQGIVQVFLFNGGAKLERWSSNFEYMYIL